MRERETMDYRHGAERFKINLPAIQKIRLHLSRKRNFIFIHFIELFNMSFVSSALRRPRVLFVLYLENDWNSGEMSYPFWLMHFCEFVIERDWIQLCVVFLWVSSPSDVGLFNSFRMENSL